MATIQGTTIEEPFSTTSTIRVSVSQGDRLIIKMDPNRTSGSISNFVISLLLE